MAACQASVAEARIFRALCLTRTGFHETSLTHLQLMPLSCVDR